MSEAHAGMGQFSEKQSLPNIKMLGDNILLEDIPMESMRGSFFVDFQRGGQKSREQELYEAHVVAVSPKWAERIPLGSRVLYTPFEGGYDLPDPTGSLREFFCTKAQNIHSIVDPSCGRIDTSEVKRK